MEKVQIEHDLAFRTSRRRQAVEAVRPIGPIHVIRRDVETLSILDTGDWRLHRGGTLVLAHGEDKQRLRVANRIAFERGTIERSRTSYAMTNDDGKIILRCSTESLRPGGTGGIDRAEREKRRAISVVRLLPLRGYESEAEEAAKRLTAMLGIEAEPYSSFVYRAAGIEPRAQKRPWVTRTEAVPTVERSLSQILERLFDDFAECLPGVRKQIDTEYLHDLRITIRRARTLLRLFRRYTATIGDLFEADLRQVGALTARVRDLDVLIEQRADYLALVPSEFSRFSDELFAEIARERDARFAALALYLESTDGVTLTAGWRDLVFSLASSPPNTPVRPAIDILLSRTLRTIRRRVTLLDPPPSPSVPAGDAKSADDSPATIIHDIRIRYKRLRYLLEFFASCYDKKPHRRLLTAVKSIQDLLGAHQDRVTHRDALIDLVERRQSPAAVTAAAGALVGRLDSSIAEMERVVIDRLIDVSNKEIPRRLRSLLRSDEGGDPSCRSSHSLI
jgi:CHAD domain-containing protein